MLSISLVYTSGHGSAINYPPIHYTTIIVTFTPTGNTLGNGALGGTDTDGTFTLVDVRGGQGAYAGEYKVSLYPTPSSDTAGLPTDVVSSGKAGIPSILLNPNKTPLRATVPETGAEVEVALSSKIQDSKVNVKPINQ